MIKQKIELTPETDVDKILESLEQTYKDEQLTTVDGLKIDFQDGWVHLRKSNTEPIIRIYSEAPDRQQAESLVQEIVDRVTKIIN